MDIFKLNPELLGILLFLAPGYLGFRLYQIDRAWSSLNTIDVIYGSLIFSTVAYGTYLFLVTLGWTDEPVRRVASLILFAVLYALLWRRFGHDLFHKGLHALGITNEDNRDTAWTRLFNNPQVYLSQITVYLKNGEQVRCEDTKLYHLDNFNRVGIHPYYADPAGNLYLICTHHRSAATDDWIEVEEIHCLSPWGIKLSLIPASEIVRVEARATESGIVSAA